MKPVYLLFFFIFTSCGSTPKFTSDEVKNNHKVNSVPERSVVKEKEEKFLEEVEGIASFYADEFNGRITANGEIFDMYDLTAAHADYPFGTLIQVTNLTNNKSAILRINDRMPGIKGRILDVSYKAAEVLGMLTTGIARVKIGVIKWGNN